MISALFARLSVPPRLWMLYSVVYFIWGTINNQIGQWLEIARFRYGFQVFTCYVLYLVPWSLLVPERNAFSSICTDCSRSRRWKCWGTASAHRFRIPEMSSIASSAIATSRW